MNKASVADVEMQASSSTTEGSVVSEDVHACSGTTVYDVNDYASYVGAYGMTEEVTTMDSDTTSSLASITPMKVMMVSNPLLARANVMTVTHTATAIAVDDPTARIGVTSAAAADYAHINEDEEMSDEMSGRTKKLLERKREAFVKAYINMDTFMSSLRRQLSLKELGNDNSKRSNATINLSKGFDRSKLKSGMIVR